LKETNLSFSLSLFFFLKKRAEEFSSKWRNPKPCGESLVASDGEAEGTELDERNLYKEEKDQDFRTTKTTKKEKRERKSIKRERTRIPAEGHSAIL
jgi:hypothetical protein